MKADANLNNVNFEAGEVRVCALPSCHVQFEPKYWYQIYHDKKCGAKHRALRRQERIKAALDFAKNLSNATITSVEEVKGADPSGH